MNFVSELVEDCPTLPSGALKEHILVLLESDKRSMKVLANMLNINTRELVSNYEECHGPVSLDTWKHVLQQLGYSKEHFQQLLSSDLMIPDATDIIDDSEENGYGTQSISRVWPEWSLPPRDEGLLNENLVEGAAKSDDDLDFSLQAAAENGPSHENNRIPPTVQSLCQGSTSTLGLVHVVENGRHRHENSTLAEMAGKEENLAASGVQADYKQRSIDETTTPSRPTTPEAPCFTHNPVVTGQHRSRQNDAVAEPYPPGNGSQERSCHGNSTLAKIVGTEGNLAASSVQADHKQQSIDKTTTPSRPTTPDAPCSTHDPVVTGQHRSRQNDAVAKPYPPGNGSQERSRHENSTVAEIAGREGNLAASSVQGDHKQQSIDKTTTPSRPTTPEAPHSTHDPVVTGQHRSRQNDAVAEPYPPGNGSQGNGNPSKTCVENDCLENNNGLYTELQKVVDIMSCKHIKLHNE